LNNVVFRLIRTASVSGAIVSAGGPIEGIQVSLMERVYDAGGRPRLVSAEAYVSAGPGLVRNTGSARTNDRGEYRLYGIKPGRYYLVVQAPQTPDTRQRTTDVPGLRTFELLRKFETTFYPGAPDLANASAIDLQSGADLSGINVVVREQQTYRVRGRVID